MVGGDSARSLVKMNVRSLQIQILRPRIILNQYFSALDPRNNGFLSQL